MAYVAISFKKGWPNRVGSVVGIDEWTVFEVWEIEDPYSKRRCGVQGCKRLIGHPERQVSPTLHADFDVNVEYEDRPGTFSMWPVKRSKWGEAQPFLSEGAIRGVAWP
jgi:hypothetical protein